MGDFDIKQRTQDGMFNATDLMKQWNKSKGTKKKLDHFFENKATEEFIQTIVRKSEDLNTRNSVYLKNRGKHGGTWMHPYLFIDFAMWINPEFKLDVIMFVHDQLIEFRHDAGDNYKELSSAVQRFKGINFPQLAKGLNWIVFNKHERGIRQQATKDQLSKLNDVQKKLAFACDMGYINSFDQLLDEMRKLYFKPTQ